jgi:hypothetical protein
LADDFRSAGFAVLAGSLIANVWLPLLATNKMGLNESVPNRAILDQTKIPALPRFGCMQSGKMVDPRTPLNTQNIPEFPCACCWFRPGTNVKS